MSFDEMVNELGALQGKTVILQVRAARSDGTLFQMIDGINWVGVDKDNADRVFANFHDAEGSVGFLRADFVDAGWAKAWRRGEKDESLLRIQVGEIEVGLQPI